MLGRKDPRRAKETDKSLSGRHQKCFWLSCNARKEALCLASVTHINRDINDTFVTNHPDDRKTPPFEYNIQHSFRNKSYLLVGGVSFKRLKTPQKRGTRHLKHTVSYLYSFFLHYITIWDQKVKNFVFYEAFLPVSWIKQGTGVTVLIRNELPQCCM